MNLSVFTSIARLILCGVCVCTCTLTARASQITVLPPHSTVAGETMSEWTAYFWQWAYSFSVPHDPFSDPTGAVYSNQAGPVCAIGSTVATQISVPDGCFILIPLVAAEVSQAELGFNNTAADLFNAAQNNANLIDSLFATLDGSAVSNLFAYREVSPVFQFVGAPNNFFVQYGGPVGPSGLAVSDGYFLMLAPPSPGTHLLSCGGTLSAFDYSASTTLQLDVVVPEPGTLGLIALGLASLLKLRTWKRGRASIP